MITFAVKYLVFEFRISDEQRISFKNENIIGIDVTKIIKKIFLLKSYTLLYIVVNNKYEINYKNHRNPLGILVLYTKRSTL